jgi:hypothetical protein
MTKHAKSGGHTGFWEDVWVDQVPLKLTFRRLSEKNINECYSQGEWVIKFNGPFGPQR